MTQFPIIFVAHGIVHTQMGMDGKFVFVDFDLSMDDGQVERIAPDVYERLKAEGKTLAKVVFAHADEYGNIHPTARDAIARHKPDLLWTCYPSMVRRSNVDPLIQQAIQGFSERTLSFIHTRGDRVLRLDEA